MHAPDLFKRRQNTIPYLVYFFAFGYLAFLASSIQPDVFFQGDGGMKFMVVKQLVAGGGFKCLHLPQPLWVHRIWQKGFFPIKEPFLYPSAEGYIVSFPPAFQLISAFLYARLGYVGLYIIPLASALLLWYWMIRMLKQAGAGPGATALALFMLVFCTPLTIYGATFWEHMPAVFLLFAGIAFIVRPDTRPAPALFLGLLSGMAVWFRPEAILMNIFYGVAVCLLNRENRRPGKWFFTGGMLLPVLAFFVFNKIVYGSLLGVHSYQVLERHTLFYKVLRGVKYAFVLNWLLIRFFPLVLLLAPVLYGLLWLKRPLTPRLKALLYIILAYCVLSPFIFPNTGGGQWGPRYFLPVIPLIIVALALIYGKGEDRAANRTPSWLILGIAAASLYAFGLNTLKGGLKELRQGYYHRIRPALSFVQAQKDEQTIVVSSEHISMEMGAVFMQRNFFLAETRQRLDSLMPLLKQQGLRDFLYINEDSISPHLPNLLRSSGPDMQKEGRYYFGKYLLP